MQPHVNSLILNLTFPCVSEWGPERESDKEIPRLAPWIRALLPQSRCSHQVGVQNKPRESHRTTARFVFFPDQFLEFHGSRIMQCPVPEYAMSGFCVIQRIHPFTTHVQLSFYDIYEASSVYSTYARFESSSILTSEFIHINPAPDCPVFVHSHN